MSWNGTVRCRECYENGHNRRTCPAVTERMKRYAEQRVEAGDPEHHYVVQYEKRIGKKMDGSTLPKAQRGSSTRRCTYCGAQGHNRRTCETLSANKAQYSEDAIAFRVRLVNAMRSAGVGIGALIKTNRWGDEFCWMITKINWDGIDHTRASRDLIMGKNVRTVDSYNQNQWMALPVLADDDGEIVESTRTTTGLVGPVVLAGVPADFFEASSLGALRNERFDKEARSEDYWVNRHE